MLMAKAILSSTMHINIHPDLSSLKGLQTLSDTQPHCLARVIMKIQGVFSNKSVTISLNEI